MISFTDLDRRSGWAQKRFIYRFPPGGGQRKVEVRYRQRSSVEWVCFLN